MTDRVILGYRDNVGYGLWVSRPGFDVNTATDDQMLFNTTEESFKVLQKGSVVVPNNGNPVYVYHNLGVIPFAYLTEEGYLVAFSNAIAFEPPPVIELTDTYLMIKADVNTSPSSAPRYVEYILSVQGSA